MSLTTLDKNILKRETTGIRPFCRCFKNDECVMATLVLDSDFQVVFNQYNILSGSYIPLRVRRDYFRQRHHQHLRKEFEPQCGHVTSACNLILVVFLLQELNGPKNGQEAKNPILVKLSEPFTARYVRFIPTSAPVLKVMRAELYGCMAEPLPPFSGMRTFTPLVQHTNYQPTYPSPSTTLTLTCYQLTVQTMLDSQFLKETILSRTCFLSAGVHEYSRRAVLLDPDSGRFYVCMYTEQK